MNEQEKRKHERLDVRIPVRYRALKAGAAAKGTNSFSQNMGEGGVRFLASEFISIATRLILEMDVPLFSKPVKVISRIAWIRKTPAGDSFEVGGHFLEMSKKDREIVSKYIRTEASGDMEKTS